MRYTYDKAFGMSANLSKKRRGMQMFCPGAKKAVVKLGLITLSKGD
jgi:hypothetical protein